MANTYPTPANFTPCDPSGPAPASAIEPERWANLAASVNLAYGTGNLQVFSQGIADSAWAGLTQSAASSVWRYRTGWSANYWSELRDPTSSSWWAYQSGDVLYVGSGTKFGSVTIDYSSTYNGAANSVTYEYWNGSAWTAFTPDSDTTGPGGGVGQGTVSWDDSDLTGWAQSCVNTDTSSYYYVRLTTCSTTAITAVTALTLGLGLTRIVVPTISGRHSTVSGAVYAVAYSAAHSAYLDVSSAGTGELVRTDEITSLTGAWYTFGPLEVDVSGEYDTLRLDVLGGPALRIESIAVWYDPVDSATWPATAGDLGTVSDGEFVQLDPALGVASEPLATALVRQLDDSAHALSVRARSIFGAVGLWETDEPCVATPKRAVTPVYYGPGSTRRVLKYVIFYVNEKSITYEGHLQHGALGWTALQASLNQGTSAGLTRLGFGPTAGEIQTLSGEVSLIPTYDPVSGAGYTYTDGYQVVGAWWEDGISVYGVFVWEVES